MKLTEEHDKQLENFSKWVPNIILCTSIFTLFFVIVVYANTLGKHTNSGSIGDTIGGSSAPFLGLLSIILLYYSFRAQIRSNTITRELSLKAIKQTREEANFRYLNDEYEKLQKRIDEFKNLLPASTKKGVEAITEFSIKIPDYWKEIPGIRENCLPALKNMKYFVRMMQNTFRDYGELDVSGEYESVIRNKMNLYYTHNLEESFKNIEKWEIAESFIRGNDVEKLSLEINTIVTDTITFLNLKEEEL